MAGIGCSDLPKWRLGFDVRAQDGARASGASTVTYHHFDGRGSLPARDGDRGRRGWASLSQALLNPLLGGVLGAHLLSNYICDGPAGVLCTLILFSVTPFQVLSSQRVAAVRYLLSPNAKANARALPSCGALPLAFASPDYLA